MKATPRDLPVAFVAFAAALCLLLVGILLVAATAADAQTKKRPKASPADTACSPVPADPTLSSFPRGDAWLSSKAYAFPFRGYTPRGTGPVIWKKIKQTAARRTHYPAPNLPSCRIGLRGTEDRTSRKASKYFEMLKPVDGQRNYVLRDTFDRPVASLEWKTKSPIARLPNRWGWYVGTKWAGRDATRAFEVQGNACKLISVPVQANVNGQLVTTHQWIRDQRYVMIAFNPSLGTTVRKNRPNQTRALRVRAFIDRRALPGWANHVANRYDFGCGASPLGPMIPQMLLGKYVFKSGYGPRRQYIVGQYFGESASPMDLLPGETKIHNNMPYSAYNPKPRFNNAVYSMINTTGIAGGGMVRGISRAGVDRFTLLDEMTYCDPNYTLRKMLLKRHGRRVSKWSYFELASFNRENKPTVRWVFGRIDPEVSTLTPEQAVATSNPLSAGLYAWMPISCDRGV